MSNWGLPVLTETCLQGAQSSLAAERSVLSQYSAYLAKKLAETPRRNDYSQGAIRRSVLTAIAQHPDPGAKYQDEIKFNVNTVQGSGEGSSAASAAGAARPVIPRKAPSYTELERLLRQERPDPEALWALLEDFVREHLLRGSVTRTNLAPDARRDELGRLVEPIPSEQVRDPEHPIFRICKKMNPDHPFNAVQVNKFTSHRQCQLHRDKRNVGDSRLAIMGDCKGGALRLEDGRKFDRKRKWYTYNGAEVAHEVEPFVGKGCL